MNDEHTGQLTGQVWQIPAYLQGVLYLQTDTETVVVDGPTGLFELSVPAQRLQLYLGKEDGTALATFSWEPDTLGWGGDIAIGGVVESISVLEHQGTPIVIVTVFGQPFETDFTAYPQSHLRGKPDAAPTAFEDALIETDEAFYTFLLPDESAFVSMAETALMNRLRIALGGRVAIDAEGWHDLVALPLVLERATVFADL